MSTHEVARNAALCLLLAACGTPTQDSTTGDGTESGSTASSNTQTSDAETSATTGDMTTGGTGGTSAGETTVEPTTGPAPGCGNAIVEGDEECDDGNADDTDACIAGCKNARCGDGLVQAGVEDCDDGNADNADACLDTCVASGCGDGFVGPGELCDDGNQVDDDACNNQCTLASCGDGQPDPGEECDDGNLEDSDACLATCKSAVCGDGVVQTGVEECDDGNQVDGDACGNTCAQAACDDGAKNGAETDIDCGGGTCPACEDGKMCVGNSDCVSGSCGSGICGSDLVLPSCPDVAVDATTLWNDVVSKRCGMACHLKMAAMGNLSMKDAATMKANLVNMPSTEAMMNLVTPNSLADSYLIYKITGQQLLAPGGSGSSMPVGMSLSEAETCMFLNWVKHGAN